MNPYRKSPLKPDALTPERRSALHRSAVGAAGLACLACLALSALPALAHGPNQPPHQQYRLGELPLESGEVIKNFTISRRSPTPC